jgi:hypothetical protein
LKPIEDQFNLATSNKKRIRYGIVPYAMMVNVGRELRDTNVNWVQTTSTYRLSGGTTASVAHDATFFGPAPSTDPATGTWDGCIEERATTNTITASSGYTIPASATDLDVDTAPSGLDTSKWIPADNTAMTANSGATSYYCPKRARKLATLANRAELENYLLASNGFTVGGATYHDIGLIWGARFLSSSGLWSTQNPTVYNTYPVTKHMIFMTDGDLNTNVTYYTSYGYESADKRVSSDGLDTTAKVNHTQRFRMMCNKIKASNTKLWVITYGTTASLTTELKNCSSGTGYGFHADTTAKLATIFKDIGENIGSLRLSK